MPATHSPPCRVGAAALPLPLSETTMLIDDHPSSTADAAAIPRTRPPRLQALLDEAARRAADSGGSSPSARDTAPETSRLLGAYADALLAELDGPTAPGARPAWLLGDGAEADLAVLDAPPAPGTDDIRMAAAAVVAGAAVVSAAAAVVTAVVAVTNATAASSAAAAVTPAPPPIPKPRPL